MVRKTSTNPIQIYGRPHAHNFFNCFALKHIIAHARRIFEFNDFTSPLCNQRSPVQFRPWASPLKKDATKTCNIKGMRKKVNNLEKSFRAYAK
jgi:hypothetical protein